MFALHTMATQAGRNYDPTPSLPIWFVSLSKIGQQMVDRALIVGSSERGIKGAFE